MADVDGTIGIGNYRYALVICKIKEDFWQFIPLKTMHAEEADRAFREICSVFCNEQNFCTLTIYRDAHRSLIRICDNLTNLSGIVTHFCQELSKVRINTIRV